MRIHLSIALLLAACSLTAFGSACTNPCTGSSSTGQDTTDRNNFLSDNSSLNFSNLTFDSGTWTAGTSGSVLNSGLTFLGCLANWSDCTSNSGASRWGIRAASGIYPWNLGWRKRSHSVWPGRRRQCPPVEHYHHAAGQRIRGRARHPPQQLRVGECPVRRNREWRVAVQQRYRNGGSQYNSATEIPLPGSVFFGYSSTSAITSLTIFAENGSTALGIDNIDVGSLTLGSGNGSGNDPSATPEASTMLLVGSGLFMLRFARKLPCFSR